MLRHLPLRRLRPHAHPFTTAPTPPPRRPRKSRKPKPKPKPKQPAPSQWEGLSAYRLTRLRHTPDPLPPASLANALLDTLLTTSVRLHPAPPIAPLLAQAASRTTYTPSDHALLVLFNAVLASARRTNLTVSTADLATETLFRLTELFNVRPTFPLLEAVAAHSAADPVFERRVPRVWSVLRAARFLQQKPSPRFIHRCFRTCIAALDLPAAVTIMDYAISNALYRHHRHPRITDYYYHLMHAALLMAQYQIIPTAIHEMHRRNIPVSTRAQAILLATYIDTSDPRAHQLRHLVKPPFPDVLHAAYIRAAGRAKCPSSVIAAYAAFEDDLATTTRKFSDTLSVPATTTLPPYAELGDRALATARADPTMTMFQALRACAAPEEAYTVLLRLRQRYGYRASSMVYTTIIEAAWRSGRLDMAKRLRVEMQASANVGYTAHHAGEPDDALNVIGGRQATGAEVINRG